MASKSAIAQIKKDEGQNLKGHMVRGILHIGIGYNLQNETAKDDLIAAGVHPNDVAEVMKEGGKPLTQEQADGLFDLSLGQAATRAKKFTPNFGKLPQTMQDTLVNMSFQLGNRLNKFDDLRAALQKGDFQAASKEMLDSEWAKQTPKRAKRLANKVIELESTPVQTTAVGQKISSQVAMEQQIFDQNADLVANLLSKDNMIDRLADLISKQPPEEAPSTPDPAPATPATPALKPKEEQPNGE